MTNPSIAPSGPRGNARGDATRSRLLEAALASFAIQGFHGTSTRDIADQAGMSPAAVYVHYRTKEDLLFALSLAGHLESQTVVDLAASTDGDPARRLREVVRGFSAWHAENHVTARVVQYEMAALTPDHAAEIRTIRRQIESTIGSILEDGLSARLFQVPSPRVATLAILSLGIDVARWYRPGGGWTPEDIGDQYSILGLQLVGYHA